MIKSSSPHNEVAETSEQSARASLPRPLIDFLVISSVLFVISAFYCALMRWVLHWGYPYDWPLFIKTERYTDFTIYQPKFAFFHTASFFTTGYPFTYPAPMAEIYRVLFLLPGRQSLHVFLAFALLTFVVASALFTLKLYRGNLKLFPAIVLGIGVLVLSWPAALVLDRANVEVFVWIATVGAVWAYANGNKWVACGLFSIAAALKLFPIIFLALFFNRKNWTKLVSGVVIFGVITLASLFLLGPTIPQAFRGIDWGLTYFHDYYMVVYLREVTGLDHSIMGLLKALIVSTNHSASDFWIRRVARFYMPVMALMGTTLYFVRIRHLPWINQVLALTIISILFTPFSGDGTLLHLYLSFAPCALLAVQAHSQGTSIPGLRPIFWCFAYLLSVESFWIANARRYEAQIKCLVLICLLVLALVHKLEKPAKQLQVV